MGDVKLALLMGATLGRPVAVAMMVGMLAALSVGVVLLARDGVAGAQGGDPVRAVPRGRLAGRALRR